MEFSNFLHDGVGEFFQPSAIGSGLIDMNISARGIPDQRVIRRLTLSTESLILFATSINETIAAAIDSGSITVYENG